MVMALEDLGVDVLQADLRSASAIRGWLGDAPCARADPIDAFADQVLVAEASPPDQSLLAASDDRLVTFIAGTDASVKAREVQAAIEDSACLDLTAGLDAVYAALDRAKNVIVYQDSTGRVGLGCLASVAAEVLVCTELPLVDEAQPRLWALTLGEYDPAMIISAIRSRVLRKSELAAVLIGTRSRRGLVRSAGPKVADAVREALDEELSVALANPNLTAAGITGYILGGCWRVGELWSVQAVPSDRAQLPDASYVTKRHAVAMAFALGLAGRGEAMRLERLDPADPSQGAVLKAIAGVFLRGAPAALESAGLPWSMDELTAHMRRQRVWVIRIPGKKRFGMMGCSSGNTIDIILTLTDDDDLSDEGLIERLGATGGHEAFHNFVDWLLAQLRGLGGAELFRAVSPLHFRTLKIGGRGCESGVFFDYKAEVTRAEFGISYEVRMLSLDLEAEELPEQ
jgi:hypothetical protein